VSDSPAEVVDSIKDPRVAQLRVLSSAAARRAAGLCVLEGRSLVGQALNAGAPIRVALRADSAGAPQDEELTNELGGSGVPVVRVGAGVLRQLSGGSRPVSWLAMAALPDEPGPEQAWGDFAVVCENIEDPGNLGTILRSARALGATDVVLTDVVTDVSSRRVLDASRGAVLATRVRRFSSPCAALRALHDAGFQVVVTSPRGRGIQALASVQGRRVALVVGNETDGVSADTEAAADLAVRIPMAGSVESLNVGVATGISLYELRTRMVLAMLTDRIRGTLGREISLTGRFVRELLDEAMRDAEGLSSAQVIALMVVAAERCTPLAELHGDLGVGPAELDELLAPLRDRGWLIVADEGRASAVTLKGEQALAALWPIQEQVEEEVCADLSPEERSTLTALLRRVQNNARQALDRRQGEH
jgi:TrmH family RNA methyltransferase